MEKSKIVKVLRKLYPEFQEIQIINVDDVSVTYSPYNDKVIETAFMHKNNFSIYRDGEEVGNITINEFELNDVKKLEYIDAKGVLCFLSGIIGATIENGDDSIDLEWLVKTLNEQINRDISFRNKLNKEVK